MKSVDYALLDELLADESLSLRQCAQRAGCSDWTARQRYRELSGDDRPMKAPRHRTYRDERQDDDEARPLTPAEKVAAWGLFAIIVIGGVALGWHVWRSDVPPYYPDAP